MTDTKAAHPRKYLRDDGSMDILWPSSGHYDQNRISSDSEAVVLTNENSATNKELERQTAITRPKTANTTLTSIQRGLLYK